MNRGIVLGVVGLVGCLVAGTAYGQGDVRVQVDVESTGDYEGVTDVNVQAQGATVQTVTEVNGERIEVVGDEHEVVVRDGGEVVDVVPVEEVAGDDGDGVSLVVSTEVVERREQVESRTALPVSVSREQRVQVRTSTGDHVVGILPDDVAGYVAAETVVDGVAEVGELVELDGEPGYEVQGTRVRRLLGVWPVKTDVSVRVLAGSGQVVWLKESWVGGLLTRLGIS